MPCAFNSCCNTCPRFVRTTAVSVVGTTLRLTIPTTTAVNHQRLCVCIAQSIPGTATPNMNVILVDGATLIPLVTKCGNFVYADQVKSRKVLRLTVATDIPQATVNNSDCLCPTAHVFPVLPPVVASEVALANPKSI